MIDQNRTARPVFGDAVGATLVTTLYARAEGWREHGVTGWRDRQAEDVWGRLQRLMQAEGQDARSLVLRDPMNVIGTVRRSEAVDRRVREAVSDGHTQVVSLGIGLCNRASRLVELEASWVGVDIAPVTALRREVITDDEVALVAGSVTDPTWLAEIDPERPTVVVAEGLLMYLHQPQVTELLVRVGDRVTAPLRLVADVFDAWAYRMPHPVKKRVGVDYHFGVRGGADGLAALVPGWVPVGTDDGVGVISPQAARLSTAWRTLTRSPMYAVATIQRA